MINGMPTISGRTRLQARIEATEKNVKLIDDFLNNLQDHHVGILGKLGELAIDRGLAQVFPTVADGDRVGSRTLLGLLTENLIANTKSDSRVSNEDARRMQSFLPSVDRLLESAPRIRANLEALRNRLLEFRKVDEKLLGVEQETPLEPGSSFTSPQGVQYEVIE